MEKDKIPQKQPPQGGQVEHEGSWTSGFESKHTPTAQPPSEPLTANPAEEPRHAEEGEYEPETVVFERGGFADPNHPAEGNGKGIKVVMPPGLDGPTALVHAVMAMMRLTEAEARAMIGKEHMQWTSYVQDGQYLDRMGNAVHILNFKPKYAERTAHEPATLKPQDKGELAQYKAFKLYLLDHDGDHIRDPYVQYDRWATDMGFFVDEPTLQVGAANMDGPRNDYAQTREAIVQYVVWERLRAKRESLAPGIEIDAREGHEEMKATVQGMADSLPALLDDGQLRQFLPDGYHGAWVALHARMIVAQGALEKGDPGFLGNPELGARIVELGAWFVQHGEDKIALLHYPDAWELDAMFGSDDMAEALRLTATAASRPGGEDFGIEQGQALLHLYYKLTFALMQVAGRIIAEPTKTAPALAVDEADIDLQGKEIENRGKAGAAMLGLMYAHPSAKKVSATFYPEAETKDFRQGGEKNGGDDWSEGMALELFLWHDADAGEWVLEDFSTVDAHKENRAKGAADAPVPAALFEELNSKLRFPKGALYYRCPDEASYRILRTSEPTEWSDWLRWAAIAGLMVGMAVASVGTSIPAQAVMIGSAVAMAGAEVASMAEESGQGMLTTERVVVHSALIASCVLGGTTGAFGILEKLGKLGATGGNVARVVAGLQVGADGVCVAVFTEEAFKGLEAAADDPEGVTFTRLLAFFLQMGMNGLMLYGMKGSMMEAAGGKEVAGLNGGASAMPTKDRAATIKALREEQASLNDELSRIWKEEGVAAFIPMIKADMNTLGAAGSLPGGISVPNYRRLFRIIGKMASNGLELNVQTVLKRLEGLGARSGDLLRSDLNIIEECIRDVRRADLTAEEIAFIDSYHLNVEGTELTNYELRDLHGKGYKVNPETGKLITPVGREVDFSRSMLSPELRTKLINFEKRMDFSSYPDLMELAELRQQQRELVAEMRREIKARQAAGETVGEAEMAAFNKATSEIGVMSEQIAEKSLQKYLDGEGFIQIYPKEGAPSSKSGDFDRIYLKQDGDRYQVFEVKGGASPIGDRLINNVEGVKKGSVAQQGTLAYLKQIIYEMGQKEASKEMAKSLEKALTAKRLDYLYYRQAFTEGGGLKNPEIGQFDIRKL